MPRIRTIKPEFWQSEKVSRLSIGARLTFIGLISHADDHGRGRWGTRYIGSTCFPHDHHNTTRNIPRYLQEISREGLAIPYKADDDCTYYWIPGFNEHQRIDRPSESKIPLPSDSAIAQRMLCGRSTLEGIKDQGSGIKEGRGGEDPPPISAQPKDLAPLENAAKMSGIIGTPSQIRQHLEGWEKSHGMEYTLRILASKEAQGLDVFDLNKTFFRWKAGKPQKKPENGYREPCPDCAGTGFVDTICEHPRLGSGSAVKPCESCGGTGKKPKTEAAAKKVKS